MGNRVRRAGEAPKSVLQVYIFRDGEFVGTDVFVEREIVIGRDPELADLLLEDSSVSREHAIVSVQRGKILIEDLGSTNGIVLNDEDEVEEAEISRLDEVGIGEFTLKFKLGRKGSRRERPKSRDLDDDEIELEAEIDEEPDPEPPSVRSARRPADKTPQGRGRRALRREPDRQRRSAPEPDDVEELVAVEEEDDFDDDLALPAKPGNKAERAPAPRRGVAPRPDGPAASAKPRTPASAPRRTPVPDPASTLAPSLSPIPDPDEGTDIDMPVVERGAEEPAPSSSVLADATLRPPAFDVRSKDAPAAELDALDGDGDDDDDDDGDEDDDFTPSYSLVERLIDEDNEVAVGKSAEALEVIATRGDEVMDVLLLRPGDAFWVGPKIGSLKRRRIKDLPPRIRLLKVTRGGACEVQYRKGAKGMLRRGRETLELKGTERKNRRGVMLAMLKQGELLDLDDAPFSYHVRYVKPPEKLRSAQQFEHLNPKLRPIARTLAPLRPSPLGARALGGSVGGHLIFFIVLAIMAAGRAETAVTSGEFVEVTLNTEDLNLEEPEPEKPEPEKAKVKSEAKPEMEAAPTKKRARAGGTSVASAGVLGLLSKRGSSAAPGPAAAVAAVSNLSASRAPGAKGGFRVSSLIGRMPTSAISVGGGGGGPVTKGALALLRGGAGGAGRLAGGKGTRTVGGMVTKVPKAMRSSGQGSLDRDEIQKVINQGVSQIQRCYERELLRTPGLSGKVQVEWTIATSGAVRVVRQSFSSLSSTAAVSCIMGRIKSWRFPRPKGGEVVVTYPFIFKPVGY